MVTVDDIIKTMNNPYWEDSVRVRSLEVFLMPMNYYENFNNDVKQAAVTRIRTDITDANLFVDTWYTPTLLYRNHITGITPLQNNQHTISHYINEHGLLGCQCKLTPWLLVVNLPELTPEWDEHYHALFVQPIVRPKLFDILAMVQKMLTEPECSATTSYEKLR